MSEIKVYIFVDGKQRKFTLEEYTNLVKCDEAVAKKKVVRVGNNLYEAADRLYKEIISEKNRKNYLKKHSDLQEVPMFEEEMALIPDEKESVEKIVECRILIENLTKAVQKLSAQERLLIKYLFFEDMTMREIAQKTGVSPSSVHRKKQLILNKLKKFMGE